MKVLIQFFSFFRACHHAALSGYKSNRLRPRAVGLFRGSLRSVLRCTTHRSFVAPLPSLTQKLIQSVFQPISTNAKNIFSFIVLLFFVQLSFAQNITFSQINSDSDVVKFVQQKNYSSSSPEWNHFYLTNGNEWKDYGNFNQQQTNQIQQSLNNISWKKIDINNDGHKDLIVSGYIAQSPKDWSSAAFSLLIFISDNKGKNFDELDLLNNNTNHYPSYFNSITLDGKNYLQIFQWMPNDSVRNIPFQTDTLQYNSFVKNFINLNNNFLPQSVKEINYFVKDDNDASFHKVVLRKINDKRCTVEIVTMQPNASDEDAHTLRIKNSYFQSVDSLVRQLNFSCNTCILNASDSDSNMPIHTTIIFSDGTKKTIKDFGVNDNYTLLAIYQAMENVMNDALRRLENRKEFWGEFLDDMAGALL